MNESSQPQKKSRKRLTVPDLIGKKNRGEKITMLTAYDFTMASLLDASGVDVLLVGDSMAMVVQGHENTLPVTLDEMIYHSEMVGRGSRHALVVVDIPFPINHQGIYQCVKASGRILKETRCQAVKLEGGAEQAEVINALVTAGIPVMAHVGLRPQAVHTMGGYKIQRDREQLIVDATAAQEAGAFAIVLECIPAEIAKELTEVLTIPTIGIGAGRHCDGQVLVINDMLGLTSGYVPSFVKSYANLKETIQTATAEWCTDVRDQAFPSDENSF
jgi:3-methyl-2-oxobutanoate hydroxymethyltransferase|tara:strand:- start:3181 stop:3999 length:819 start_codon:yes stop_codon:yes gene_type:complete